MSSQLAGKGTARTRPVWKRGSRFSHSHRVGASVFTLEANKESGDVRILREGDGEDSEEEDTGGNDDGGERAEGAARAVWISAGLAAAATLFSGSALLFL